MIDDFASRIEFTSTRTRIGTFSIDTSTIGRTFGACCAFGTTGRWTAHKFRRARANRLIIDDTTLTVGSAGRWAARICVIGRWVYMENMENHREQILNKSTYIFKNFWRFHLCVFLTWLGNGTECERISRVSWITVAHCKMIDYVTLGVGTASTRTRIFAFGVYASLVRGTIRTS